jgi:hypothetical protein
MLKAERVLLATALQQQGCSFIVAHGQ